MHLLSCEVVIARKEHLKNGAALGSKLMAGCVELGLSALKIGRFQGSHLPR